MKRMLLLLAVLCLLLCGCSQSNSAKETIVFAMDENGNVVSDSGVAYAHLASEGFLCYLGELEFVGGVQGEAETTQHLGMSFQTGMFAIKHDESSSILIRHAPNSEWRSIYRDASLPEFDFSVDNCIRLEFVPGIGDIEKDAVHTACGEGITDPAEIAAFLSDVRAQKSPSAARLYDLVKKPDGTLENCYICGVIYGFFEEETNLAVQMQVTSYNDLAYSVSIGGRSYVLPSSWYQKLVNH